MSIVTKRGKLMVIATVIAAMVAIMVGQALAGGHAWSADYHSNRWFSWGKSFTYQHDVIDFNWGFESPAPSLPVDDFGVRYNRVIHTDQGGWYQFDVAADGYAMVVVNGQQIINLTQPGLEYGNAKVFLQPGNNYVYAQYQEDGGIAKIRIAFYPTTQPVWN